jgi:hypothetical protein
MTMHRIATTRIARRALAAALCAGAAPMAGADFTGFSTVCTQSGAYVK